MLAEAFHFSHSPPTSQQSSQIAKDRAFPPGFARRTCSLHLPIWVEVPSYFAAKLLVLQRRSIPNPATIVIVCADILNSIELNRTHRSYRCVRTLQTSLQPCRLLLLARQVSPPPLQTPKKRKQPVEDAKDGDNDRFVILNLS